MKKLILGIIGIFITLILCGIFLKESPTQAQNAYSAGRIAGAVLSLLILVPSLYAIISWTKAYKAKR